MEKTSHLLTKPDPNYLKLLTNLTDLSGKYKKLNSTGFFNRQTKQKLDRELDVQKKFANEKLKLNEKEFTILFNKLNLNFYPKETDSEITNEILIKIKDLERQKMTKNTDLNQRRKIIHNHLVYLVPEVVCYEGFIESLICEHEICQDDYCECCENIQESDSDSDEEHNNQTTKIQD
ncbi:unnamed protein product [Brachionus calyciflorus]|uniref:Uncharacterized protein n=1 Tax=Brachionus calyciflorus TaxID=104777 RepID=A0A813VHG4_9BILA|nr:unnamed protein product [Brachionus calyciflorus]